MRRRTEKYSGYIISLITEPFSTESPENLPLMPPVICSIWVNFSPMHLEQYYYHHPWENLENSHIYHFLHSAVPKKSPTWGRLDSLAPPTPKWLLLWLQDTPAISVITFKRGNFQGEKDLFLWSFFKGKETRSPQHTPPHHIGPMVNSLNPK